MGPLLEITESPQHLPLLVGEIFHSGEVVEPGRCGQLPGEELSESDIDGQIVKGGVAVLAGIGYQIIELALPRWCEDDLPARRPQASYRETMCARSVSVAVRLPLSIAWSVFGTPLRAPSYAPSVNRSNSVAGSYGACGGTK